MGIADQTYAALTRSLFENYVTEFMPYENKLISFASDPAVVGNAMSEASGLVQRSFDAQQGATQRRLRGLGLQLSEDEQQAADRSSALSRSLADVNAQNVAGTMTRQRQQSVLGNPAPNVM